MPATIRPFAPGDERALERLLADPDIGEQFEAFAGPTGTARLLADPQIPHAGIRLACDADEPVGFAFAALLPGPPVAWAMVRGAVRAASRRRGIGRALHESVTAYAAEQRFVPDIRESVLTAWHPSPAAEAMANALGYAHDRWFWLMARARGGTPPVPAWPAGVTTRAFDGSEQALADWNDAYNASFAGHYRYVPSPLESVRKLARAPGFRADGLLLAYRAGRVAGFCRNDLLTARGEVGTLGTLPEARGIGLGRALLRWGVAWLEAASTLPVTLVVDGANDGALRLYQSEGFATTRTRRIWLRRAAPR